MTDIIQDLNTVKSIVEDIGLQLNMNKSELICKVSTTKNTLLDLFPEMHIVDAECATLLGSPIDAISEAINEKINLLKVMGNK